MLPDKSVFSSWTAWGAFLYAAGQAAEQVGFLPAGVSTAVTALGSTLGPLLVILGIRRSPGVSGVSGS